MTDAAASNGRHGSDGLTDVIDQHAQIRAQLQHLRERPRDLAQALTSYVGYELGRRVRMGQIDYEDLLRDEVVDSAFAAALSRLEQGHPIRDLHTWLRSRAQDMIGREVRRIQQERRQHVSLEQTVMASDAAEGGEDVRIVDIIPDQSAREPEQIAVNNETMAFMIDVLADVPDVWRTVFLQRTIQDRSAREVAELEGLDIDEVRRITIRTREYLRERFDAEYEDLFDLDA
jgi:RNA polymerase sigma factor (sigma-70 family)